MLVARRATALFLLAVGAAACAGGPAPRDGLAVVTGVVDGDTIDVRLGERTERVRLIGIDTPETRRPGAPPDCHGPEASAYTTALLPIGTLVRLERDVVGRDDYGRLLAYVHLPPPGETGERTGRGGTGDAGLFVNLELVERGLAVPMPIEPNDRFATAFVDAARRAEAADRGLWHACSTTRHDP